jgi:hypothetical protein
VSKIDLYELIKLIPELLNLFLSGFICITIFNWLANKKMEFSTMTLWSVFTSILIKSCCSLIHSFCLTSIVFSEYSKIIIYVLIGCILPFIAILLCKNSYLQKILYKISSKSVCANIFDDVLDYKKRTTLQVYLKDSNIMYIGTFKFLEENGLDSYIVLIDYASFDKQTKAVIFEPDKHNLHSVAVVNLRDIERIEIIYSENSEVWKRIT